MSKHPSWEQIVGAIEAGTDGGATSAANGSALDWVLPHVSSCATCRHLADRASALTGVSVLTTLEEPPPALVALTMARVTDALRTKHQAAGSSLADVLVEWAQATRDELTTVWATLVAGGEPSPVLRGGDTAPQTVLYDTPDYSISLSLKPGSQPETVDVAGQVMPKTADALPGDGRVGARVGDQVREVNLAADGRFRVTSLPRGTLQVELGVGRTLVRMAPLAPPPTAPGA